jgi:autophagy-related protein 5
MPLHQIQAPRIAYLPLLLPDIHKHLLSLCLDDSTLATLRDEDLWFELDGEPLRWQGAVCWSCED